jgi:RNA polymerase sigma-70 factor (ECF subfamily)
MEKAKAGDREAIDALVGRYRDPLDRHIRLRVGEHLRSKVEVDDVFQETLARALRSLESFQWRGEDSFLRWLKGIAEHVILKAASSRRPDQFLFVEGEDVAAGGASPSRALRQDERFERLKRSLESLSPEYREVIILARIKGLRTEEIARRLNRSPNAVGHLLSRGLAKLKSVFGETESFHLPPRRLDGAEEDHDR